MVKRLKNNKKGFTLVEIIVAIGIMVLFGGFAITTISVVPQARMRNYAETIKSEFELTRNFAKTHGGDATFTITKTKEGFAVTRSGGNLTTETHTIKDRDVAIFYLETGDIEERELVEGENLSMTFSQTQGAIIGPDLLDCIVVSNGNKNYKFIIKQSTGMMYYDYEIDENDLEGNMVNENVTTVDLPSFILADGSFSSESVTLTQNGKSLQPDIKYDARHVKIGGVYRAVEQGGPYYITFTLKDPYKTRWSDGTTDVKTLTWNIQ